MVRRDAAQPGALRAALGRGPLALGIAALTLFVAACNQVGTNNLTFWDVVWSMVVFFFWFMLIWIFIGVFADIFRRNDMTGVTKAIWIIAIVILPFLGCLIYMVMRPKATAQDVQMMAQAEAAQRAAASVSTADELAKLQQLRDSGTITASRPGPIRPASASVNLASSATRSPVSACFDHGWTPVSRTGRGG